MKKKTVTLPIGSKAIFEKIAAIAWSVEDDKDPDEKEEFINYFVQELGKEAFLHSFTPSGEIGDGSNIQSNPVQQVDDFYRSELSDLFGENGTITSILSENTSSDAVVKSRELRYKGAIISLIKLFIEAHDIDNPMRKKRDVARIKRFIAVLFFMSISDIFCTDLKEIFDHSRKF